jgi:spore germination protein GerM
MKVRAEVATVEFGGSGLAALRTIPRLRVIGSVTYTLTSFPTIRTVRFTLNGRAWGVYDHAGRVIRDYRRGTLSHPWRPACAPEDGCFAP